MPSIQMYMACTFSPCGSFMYMCLMALLRWELAEVAMAAVLTRGFLQGTTTNSPSCEPFPACPHFSAAPLPHPRPGRSRRQLSHRAGCHLQRFPVIPQGEHTAAQASSAPETLQNTKLLLINQSNRLPKGSLAPHELFTSTLSRARLMQGKLSWVFLNKSASSRRAFLPQLPSQPG